ncbi:MAG: metallophosphoesterase [Armatimonadota bacterium]
MFKVLLPLLLLPLCCVAFAGTVTGHVFIDANNDGQLQAGEPPVAGALVSDGLTVVATEADGAYQLTVPDGDQVVFIDNPKGTWPTKGSYRNVKVGPAQADFPLRQHEQKLPFYFVQGTDLHTRPQIADQMAQYVQAINSLPVPLAFVVHTGDLVNDTNGQTVDAARELFTAYQQMVAPLAAPLLNIPGNHEHVAAYRPDFSPQTPGMGKSLYREMFGPMYYAFNYAGVHFIALDGSTVSPGKVEYITSQPCLDWLKTYLERLDKSEPLVLLIHEPLGPSPIEKARIEPILAGRKVLLTLSGHWHIVSRSTLAGAPEIIAGATSYAWHGGPFPPNPLGYNLVKITGDGFESAMGDWAQQYPVTVNAPARAAILADTVKVDAQFLDRAGEVTTAEVALGNAKQTVTQFGTQGLCRTVQCELPLPALPDGFHDLTITLRGKGEPCVERQPFLILSGTQEPFTATAPATLSIRVRNVNAENIIKLNGEELCKMQPEKGADQTLSVPIPPEKLRRLNMVELISAPLADGTGYDNFSYDVTSILYDGKISRDYRLYNAGGTVRLSPAATTSTLYYDLTRSQ